MPAHHQQLIIKERNLVLTLKMPTHGFPAQLTGHTLDGFLKFTANPPEGFAFSCLTVHPETEIAVVCSAGEKMDGWYDWHFSIDPETGRLKRWCPAK